MDGSIVSPMLPIRKFKVKYFIEILIIQKRMAVEKKV